MTDLYNEILNSDLNKMILNESDLLQLKENYCTHIIDGLDMDDLVQMCHDLLLDAYKDCTEEELKEEIIDLYDEQTLLELLP